MATSPAHNDMNTEYDPSKDDAEPELVLNVIKTDPLPCVSPYRVVQRTGDDFDKFDAHHALSSLVDAGWVYHRERGLYDLKGDPRENVPSWPVDWTDVDTLPGPKPEHPPATVDTIDTVRAIHARYRE